MEMKARTAPRAGRNGRAQASELSHADAERALSRATAEIQKLEGRYTVGVRLLHVEALELFRADGFASVTEYGAHVLETTEEWVAETIRVAGAFREDIVAVYGFEKLERALRSIVATPGDASQELSTITIPVPAADGNGLVQRPFAALTVAELRRAKDRIKSAQGDAPPEEPTGLRRAIAAADRALAGAGTVRTRRGEAGELVVDVEGVPWKRAAKVLAAAGSALRRAKTKSARAKAKTRARKRR
jgi:hypothetical protein